MDTTEDKLQRIMEKPLLRLGEVSEVLKIDSRQVLKFVEGGVITPVKATENSRAYYRTREVKALL